MMGGFSTLMCFGMWAFFDKSIGLLTVSQFAFALAFAVNHPHFLSSYILLYKDFKSSILKKKRYFWSAILAPVLLFGLLAAGLWRRDQVLMGHMVNAMYFLVGWHYVKQIFGCVIVTSVQRKIFYKNWERKLLLFNLFTAWFMSWLGSNVGANNYSFYGIAHSSMNLPPWCLTVAYTSVGLSFSGVALMQIFKYINEGVKPSPPAVAAVVALYSWYLPTLTHPGFGYLIPFFHSLQYLAFVWMFKKNQVSFEIKSFKDKAWRLAWIKKMGGFVASACVLGALCFEFIPKGLDQAGLVPVGIMGDAPFVAVFLLFINIHHYFIDNTIWRSDNEAVKQFLFASNEALAHQEGEHSKAA
jgi:hypothetical protein